MSVAVVYDSLRSFFQRRSQLHPKLMCTHLLLLCVAYTQQAFLKKNKKQTGACLLNIHRNPKLCFLCCAWSIEWVWFQCLNPRSHGVSSIRFPHPFRDRHLRHLLLKGSLNGELHTDFIYWKK